MNIQSIVVLAILSLLLVLALRCVKKGQDEGHCNGCSQQGCSGQGEGRGACPSVANALDEVDRRLGGK